MYILVEGQAPVESALLELFYLSHSLIYIYLIFRYSNYNQSNISSRPFIRTRAFLFILLYNAGITFIPWFLMETIILQFSDILQLVNFTLVADLKKCSVIESELLVICELNEADIELALNGYNAIIKDN